MDCWKMKLLLGWPSFRGKFQGVSIISLSLSVYIYIVINTHCTQYTKLQAYYFRVSNIFRSLIRLTVATKILAWMVANVSWTKIDWRGQTFLSSLMAGGLRNFEINHDKPQCDSKSLNNRIMLVISPREFAVQYPLSTACTIESGGLICTFGKLRKNFPNFPNEHYFISPRLVVWYRGWTTTQGLYGGFFHKPTKDPYKTNQDFMECHKGLVHTAPMFWKNLRTKNPNSWRRTAPMFSAAWSSDEKKGRAPLTDLIVCRGWDLLKKPWIQDPLIQRIRDFMASCQPCRILFWMFPYHPCMVYLPTFTIKIN